MSDFADLARLTGRSSALPPLASEIRIAILEDDTAIEVEIADAEPQPISAFVCVIDYQGETRLITCRRYETIGENAYVGAYCHSARGYRQFRCDRIDAVFDARTGEAIGAGDYFERFAVDGHRERAPTWGLTASRRATLVAGLNVMAFMARCDGRWHPLESEPVEKFVCSMWLRKEWENEPPLDEIMVHAQRLAPDSQTFFSALRHYADSETSKRILCRAIGDLIAADGEICASEIQWGAEIDAFFRGYREAEFRRYFAPNSEDRPNG